MKHLLKIIFACFIVSIGVLTLRHANIVTGGTAGLALTISYFIHQHFFLLFFLINIPFYIFSILTMGGKFTVNTIFAVSMLTLFTGIDTWLPTFHIPSLLGSIAGGSFIGLGLTYLFRQGSSLGGANILALFFQKKFGLDPGKINFLFDFLVVLLSFFTIGLVRLLISIVSIGITSIIISYFKQFIANAQVDPVRQASTQADL